MSPARPASAAASWTEADILTALSEWGWAPDGTEIIDTGDYRVQFLPEQHGHQAAVPRVSSSRPAQELIQEINRLAADRGYRDVSWSVYPTTTPQSLGDDLIDLGGDVRDEGALMSLHVPDDGILDVGPTDGIEVRRVDGVDRLTDYRKIISTVYRQRLPSAAEIADEAAGIGQHDRGCRFVSYIDDQPAGSGAIAIRSDGSASLFGAATYPEHRGRGAYRAILAARTRWARDNDVPILLVSGRLATSAPIMQRVGFVHRGYTRNISLSTGAVDRPADT